MMYVHRMWINAPSTLQPFHSLHGVRVAALGDWPQFNPGKITRGFLHLSAVPSNLSGLRTFSEEEADCQAEHYSNPVFAVEKRHVRDFLKARLDEEKAMLERYTQGNPAGLRPLA
jgi:hypothetical protein